MKRWLSRYLSVLTLAPVFVLVIFIFVDILRAYTSLEQANQIIADVNLVSVTSELVHSMQKERGMSAAFIGSNGIEFTSEIRNQRAVTDQEILNLKELMLDIGSDTNTNTTLHSSSFLTTLSNCKTSVNKWMP
jgi:hypothetical protein